MRKRKGFNERKYILQYKEFKKKNEVYEITKKINKKRRKINNEYNTIYDLRYEKLKHNASTNQHLQSYIADLNFRLYSLQEKGKIYEPDELKIIQKYTEVISLLDKFQNIKGEKFLNDRKELEDQMIEKSLEEQMKELSLLARQEKYEKYICDKLLLAQNGLVDICQKYRTEVHICENYEQTSQKLKSEYSICLETNKQLNEILSQQKKIGQKLSKKIKEEFPHEKHMTFYPIIPVDNNSDSNEVFKLKRHKKRLFSEKINQKINKIRPKTGIRLNKNNSDLINNKNNINENQKNNSILKRNSSAGFFNFNHMNYGIDKKTNYGRTYLRKINFKKKSFLNKRISNNSTNYITKSIIHKNKSMNDIIEEKNINENIYNRKYLDLVTQYLNEKIGKIKEEIKLKNQLKAEEIRSSYQLKYILGKCIEDIEVDLDNEKKNKNNINSNLHQKNMENNNEEEAKKLNNKKSEEDNIKNYEYQLYIMTFIFDNCFNGTININSIFPK